MKPIILGLLAIILTAQEPKPATTFEQLQAKVAQLEAQLVELRLMFQYEQQVCALPDLMRAKLATAEANAKVMALATKPAKVETK